MRPAVPRNEVADMPITRDFWRVGAGVLVAGATATGVMAADPPKAVDPPSEITPVSAKVTVAEPRVNGADALPKALAEAKAVYAKTRDYSGYMVRQERVSGKLLPEQTAELRVRTEPFAIYTKTVAPKSLLGQELAFSTGKKDDKVRVKAAGVAGVGGFVSVAADDPKAMADSRHTLTNTGIGAVLKRVESAWEAEKKAKTSPQVLVAEYKFQDRPCTRYEVFCERPHAQRYAYRLVVCIDSETKLPVRFEAHDAPKGGEATGEMIECVSFVGLKMNAGLGEATFDK
jgi:hypothetical protein